MINSSAGTLLTTSVLLSSLIMGTALISTSLGQSKNMQASGAPSEGFRLSAMLGQEKLKLGEPLLLKLSLKNITKKELYVVETTADQDYEIEVTDEHGTRGTLTGKGRRLMQGIKVFTKVISVKVAPGQEQQVDIKLDEIYNLSAKGTYSVTAKRMIPKLDRNGSVEIVSNTVKVTIY